MSWKTRYSEEKRTYPKINNWVDLHRHLNHDHDIPVDLNPEFDRQDIIVQLHNDMHEQFSGNGSHRHASLITEAGLRYTSSMTYPEYDNEDDLWKHLKQVHDYPSRNRPIQTGMQRVHEIMHGLKHEKDQHEHE